MLWIIAIGIALLETGLITVKKRGFLDKLMNLLDGKRSRMTEFMTQSIHTRNRDFNPK